MAKTNLDACVLSSSGNVHYATGVSSLSSDPSHVISDPTLVIVTHDEVRAFVSYREGVPPNSPRHRWMDLYLWNFQRALPNSQGISVIFWVVALFVWGSMI